MNKFTNLRYHVPRSWEYDKIINTVKWCRDNIGLKGDKWDVDITWESSNDSWISVKRYTFVFDNKEASTLFSLVHVDHDVQY